jgi:protein-L-isoaspartate(D-aspartate) O-methyltransferase
MPSWWIYGYAVRFRRAPTRMPWGVPAWEVFPVSEEHKREWMVREQLRGRKICDQLVLEAMGRVPRHLFVPEALRERAYEDRAHPIGNEQTISQPLMVALMTQLLQLRGNERVLEIGTGSGYQAAILAEIVAEVISIERHPNLAERARGLLEYLGYCNVRIFTGDGSLGYPSLAPFDRILVTAAAPHIPPSLLHQLRPGGRMVLPVGRPDVQSLQLVLKHPDGQIETEDHGECVFVPLLGEEGWPAPPILPKHEP